MMCRPVSPLGANRPALRMQLTRFAAAAFVCAAVIDFGGDALSSEWRSGPEAGTLLPMAAGADEATAPAAAPTARVVRRLPLKTGGTAVAWSPDGKLLAAMGGLKQHFTVWEARTGKVIWEAANEFGGDGEALAFSKDGRLLLAPAAKTGAADQNAVLILWDAANGTVAGHVAGPSPNGGWVGNFARRLAIDRGHDRMAVVTAGLGALDARRQHRPSGRHTHHRCVRSRWHARHWRGWRQNRRFRCQHASPQAHD